MLKLNNYDKTNDGFYLIHMTNYLPFVFSYIMIYSVSFFFINKNYTIVIQQFKSHNQKLDLDKSIKKKFVCNLE